MFMFLSTEYIQAEYTRASKTGLSHTYTRTKTILVFRCDNCNEIFKREKGSMDPKRISNNYFHVCANCDIKKFAQRKAVERKHLFDLKTSSLQDISKI